MTIDISNIVQHLYRIRCWFRGYHVYGVGLFRYDCSGVCDDCGVVGTGVLGPGE